MAWDRHGSLGWVLGNFGFLSSSLAFCWLGVWVCWSAFVLFFFFFVSFPLQSFSFSASSAFLFFFSSHTTRFLSLLHIPHVVSARFNSFLFLFRFGFSAWGAGFQEEGSAQGMGRIWLLEYGVEGIGWGFGWAACSIDWCALLVCYWLTKYISR